MPSSLAVGPTLRLRGRSIFGGGIVGKIKADFQVTASPAAGTNRFVFVAPKACRVVGIQEVHSTAGGAASVISVRHHLAGSTALVGDAVGATVLDLVTGGILADGAVSVPQSATVVKTADDLAAGAKIAVLTPASWVGVISIWLVWR